MGLHAVLKPTNTDDFLNLVETIRNKLHLLTKPEAARRVAKSIFVAFPVAVKVGLDVDTTLDYLYGQRTMGYSN